MASWHLLRRLALTVGAHSSPALSRALLPSSPSLLTHCSSSPSFLSSFKLIQPWLPHLNAANISTPSSSSQSLLRQSLATPYLSVLIHCPKDVADVLADALLCFGASSASIDEVDACVMNDEICISSIFPEDEDVSMCISHAADSIGLKKIPKYEVKIGEHDDWMKKSQESFHPIEIIEGLWVVPEWRTPPDAQATNIILNPGLSFGTGEHPTTKLCLLLLHGCIKGGEDILDYGTGSGILSIAALKFGAAFAVGIDIDPQAIESASQNATLNNIGPEKLQLHLVSSKPSLDEEEQKYDVVIANILLNPLLDLADQIVSSAKPGAVIGLSGILCEQVRFITERYSPFLEGMAVTEMDDWACVSGRKKSNLDVC
ncbi:Ribosomal protein L11 methyltransferase [Senna tora]|uniref:ETFB lysine methyltransferase n=1 Tax=Senna tora TaxID=362788 RepID=A0A834TI85_9FABA|nr:Ribosomal protein L11 methyltransferase [Senna tora]